MVPGLMCAWMEGIPLLAIGTQRVRRSIHAVRRGRFQYGPQLEVVRPVTKFAAERSRRWAAFRSSSARRSARRCIGRPGPAYLELPADLLLEEVDEDEAPVLDPTRHGAALGAPDADAAVAAAVALLEAARFPLVLAGHGVHRADAAHELRGVAEHLGALVMTTPGARGAFPEDHPQSVGMTFPWGTPAHLDSDVVLAVGTALGESMQYLQPPAWAGPARQRVVHLDVDPGQIGVNRATDVALVGGAGPGSPHCSPSCGPGAIRARWPTPPPPTPGSTPTSVAC